MEDKHDEHLPGANAENTGSSEEAKSPDIFAFRSRIDLSHLQTSIEKAKEEIGKVIIGQKELVELLLISIITNGHTLIEGVPGVAKTVTAKLLAKTLDVDFSRIQFTPDLMPSDILGTSIFNVKTTEFEFKKGPIFSNIILIDEINRAPAKTQAALFEVMAERQITIDGERHPMTAPFLVFATQNPIEQEGTYALPEAQLDRFLFKVNVGYPNVDEEFDILMSHHQRENVLPLDMITSILTAEEIREYQEQVHKIVIEENLLRYIAAIVNNTRINANLYLGASPRASIALMNASKGLAAIRGRDFVTPEDIKYMTAPVLRHRILLTPEREMEGMTSDTVISQIVETIEIPR